MGIFGKKDTGIFETLKLEHREVSSLLEQILEGGVGRIVKGRDLFAVAAQNLLAHAKGEELVVYPRFSRLESLRTTILEARQEHELIEALLMKLDTEELDDESWIASIKVLHDQIAHHVKEEEGEVFKKAKDEITAEESAALAQTYLAAKRDLAETMLVEQLEALSVGELLERAEELGIPSQGSMSKAELIAVICTRL